MSELNLMDIKEFLDLGFVQELNRQFLHPRGLALMVETDADGTHRLGGILDYRSDPEGVLFSDGMIDAVKANYVADELSIHEPVRMERFGYVVQPVPDADT